MLEVYIVVKKENEDKRDLSQRLLKEILWQKKLIQVPVIEKNPHGKPFISNIDGFHYNISHSGNYVGIAVSDRVVGFDLQKKDRQKDVMSIADRWFNQEEVKALRKCDSSDLYDHFYDLWTKKESYMKYRGLGFALPMKDFRIGKDEGRPRVFQDGKVLRQIELYGLNWKEDYRMAVCSDVNDKPTIIQWD